ncbi:flavo protein WrbA [Rozella allomycis CSF55]|uniref:Flavo protein WrbA n=1 Tax=Rozella allomycis (strain CSF55) TaxID=988480 RepID=A0A075B1R9_ROZAC|nr:Flavoprotein WrbA domain-containing protein [Rozella allomycis CSF55]RKP20170.1 flavo protein WrbA [Rozella allomycis CSF55]|eukprot:EPZ34916.1 Flavoprotein WrbA domain-containing protein [Rozella allomycis CSF55]
MTKPKVFVIIYTTYHHMAERVKAGLEKAGVEATIYQVAETLPADVLAKMGAPPKPNVPVITAADLEKADGFVFGFPTRYGMIPAQFKAFWDSTGQLWAKGALVGKMAATFTSTATLGGGQETTHLTFISQLVHHGIVYVPLGYTNQQMFNIEEVHGGSPYGAGCIAGGDGSRQPSELELSVAEHQGSHFGKTISQYKK